MTEHDEQITCGVGDDGSPGAVDYAALQAQRRRASLHLVRVTNPYAEPDAGSRGERLLASARARAATAHPGLVVTEEVVDRGWVAGGLTEAARSASLLVIEQTTSGMLRRLVSGSTADGLAVRASCPVVVVPAGWHHEPSASAVVTVAVQDVDEAPLLVGAALREAADLEAEVHVLHAVWTLKGFEAPGERQRAWEERATSDLSAALGELLSDHPEVKLSIDVVNSPPVDAITNAAATSLLLVLGRRHHHRSWGTHLGPVAHRVLLEAGCPVLLPAAPADSPEVTSLTRLPDASDASGELAQVVTGPGPEPDDVVVGIGPGDMSGALTFAAAEARRRRAGVHLVRAVAVPDVDGVVLAETWREDIAEARREVDAALAHVRSVAPDIRPLTAEVVERGQVTRVLRRRATDGAVLVLQHRRVSALHRLVTHSVTNAVAGSGTGIVIAVPEGWGGSSKLGRVVVGIVDPEACDAAVDAGFAEAQRRGTPLVLAHSVWSNADFSSGVLEVTTPSHWTEQARERLTAIASSRRDDYPDVLVQQVVEHVAPVEFLSRLSGAHDILVVEARRHGWDIAAHLGPVTRALLAVAPCPIVLVPSISRR